VGSSSSHNMSTSPTHNTPELGATSPQYSPISPQYPTYDFTTLISPTCNISRDAHASRLEGQVSEARSPTSPTYTPASPVYRGLSSPPLQIPFSPTYTPMSPAQPHTRSATSTTRSSPTPEAPASSSASLLTTQTMSNRHNCAP
jgi:DNA-directed RNA polymerase II subunit RPB1